MVAYDADLMARVAARVAWRKQRAMRPAAAAAPAVRTCAACKRTMPVIAFKRNRSKPGGYDYRCHACHRDAEADRRRRDPAKHRANSAAAMRRYRARRRSS